jgi:hypothetical protein
MIYRILRAFVLLWAAGLICAQMVVIDHRNEEIGHLQEDVSFWGGMVTEVAVNAQQMLTDQRKQTACHISKEEQ